jgi:hypothetical protein
VRSRRLWAAMTAATRVLSCIAQPQNSRPSGRHSLTGSAGSAIGLERYDTGTRLTSHLWPTGVGSSEPFVTLSVYKYIGGSRCGLAAPAPRCVGWMPGERLVGVSDTRSTAMVGASRPRQHGGSRAEHLSTGHRQGASRVAGSSTCGPTGSISARASRRSATSHRR